jgi:undecaprenyl-diphosphatase
MLAGIVAKGRSELEHGVGVVARELTATVRHARPGVPVLLLWLGLALALGVVSGFAAGADYFAGDLWLTRKVQAIDIDGFSRAGRIATNLSSPNASAAMLLGAVVGLALLRQLRLALFAAASAWAHLIGGILKLLVDRPRPSGDLIETVRLETEFSYPSGHTEWIVGFEGFLVFAVWQLTPNRFLRLVAAGAWTVHIILAGLGRVDQGLHWPSDVLGGLLAGALALSVTVWAYLASRRAAALTHH